MQTIPKIGLGLWTLHPKKAYETVLKALEFGYRHFDSSPQYKNEKEVGKAIKDSLIPRSEIFVSSKLFLSDADINIRKSALISISKTLEAMNLDYIDLYLLNAPFVDKWKFAWSAMEEINESGRALKLGVSNFGIHHLEELKKFGKVVPLVNQLELHPFLQRRELVDYCIKNNIQLQAYSPLTKGKKLKDPVLLEIARGKNKSVAQVLLKWSIQKGFIALPKTAQEARLRDNLQVFDWELDQEEMKKIDALENHEVLVWDPTVWV